MSLSSKVSHMPPKKKGKSGAEGSMGSTLPSTVNDDYFIEFQKALDCIKGHKAFHGIIDRMPDSAGGLAVFDLEDMVKALNSKGHSYTASGNFFWLDLLFSTMRGVPFNRTNIQLMVEHQFAKPAIFAAPIEIAVADVKHFEPFGSWRSVTPEEKLHAFVWAIHRDITAEPKVADKVIKEWATMAVKATFSFSLLVSEDGFPACSYFPRV